MTQTGLLQTMAENGFPFTQQRLSHIMQGRNYADPPVLRELVRAMGISADYALGLTEEPLPAAYLDEQLKQIEGEGKLDRLVNKLPKEKQQQVFEYVEYLLSKEPGGRSSDAMAESRRLAEARQVNAEMRALLDSVERTRGLAARQELDKVFRDKGLYIGQAS